MSTKTKLSSLAQGLALNIIAEYLGPKMGYIKPCGRCAPCKAGLEYDFECEQPKPMPAPTGQQAADRAEGPHLNPVWDWPSSGPTPTILLEGGPEDWAIEASMDETVIAKMSQIGVYCEPYASYALCLYPA